MLGLILQIPPPVMVTVAIVQFWQFQLQYNQWFLYDLLVDQGQF